MDIAGSYSCSLTVPFADLPAGLRDDAPFAAALAAVELLARLNRRLAVRVASGSLGVGLRHWPDGVRHGSGGDVRATLAPFASPAGEGAPEPHLAVTLALGDEPAPAGAAGGRADVRVLCRIDGAALRVDLHCGEDDPWRRMTAPAAEIFAELLRELLSDPGVPARAARGIGAASRSVVLGPLAGGAVGVPFRAIPHAIEDTTDRYPERPALSYGERSLELPRVRRAGQRPRRRLGAARHRQGRRGAGGAGERSGDAAGLPGADEAGRGVRAVRPGLAGGPHRGDARGALAQADRLHRPGRAPARVPRARPARRDRRARCRAPSGRASRWSRTT